MSEGQKRKGKTPSSPQKPRPKRIHLDTWWELWLKARNFEADDDLFSDGGQGQLDVAPCTYQNCRPLLGKTVASPTSHSIKLIFESTSSFKLNVSSRRAMNEATDALTNANFEGGRTPNLLLVTNPDRATRRSTELRFLLKRLDRAGAQSAFNPRVTIMASSAIGIASIEIRCQCHKVN